MMRVLPCAACGGEGRKYTSRFGGNDPDTIDAGGCEFCEGSGNQKCEERGCSQDAIVFDEDGRALCEDCHIEWVTETFAR